MESSEDAKQSLSTLLPNITLSEIKDEDFYSTRMYFDDSDKEYMLSLSSIEKELMLFEHSDTIVQRLEIQESQQMIRR